MRQIFKLVNITTTKYKTYLRGCKLACAASKKLKGTEVIFSTSFLAVNCMNYEKKKEKKNPHFVPFFGLIVTKRKLQTNQE